MREGELAAVDNCADRARRSVEGRRRALHAPRHAGLPGSARTRVGLLRAELSVLLLGFAFRELPFRRTPLRVRVFLGSADAGAGGKGGARRLPAGAVPLPDPPPSLPAPRRVRRGADGVTHIHTSTRCDGERGGKRASAPAGDRGSTGQFCKRRPTAGPRAGGDGGAAAQTAKGDEKKSRAVTPHGKRHSEVESQNLQKISVTKAVNGRVVLFFVFGVGPTVFRLVRAGCSGVPWGCSHDLSSS